MAKSEKKQVLTQEKSDFAIAHGYLKEKETNLCKDLDLSLLYILILGTYNKFARQINFSALGVYCPAGQSAFRRARPQLKLGVCVLLCFITPILGNRCGPGVNSLRQ